MSETFILRKVPANRRAQEAEFHRRSGAEVEEIPEGNGEFSLKIIRPGAIAPVPTNGGAASGLNWSGTRPMDAKGPHTQFAGGLMWAYDNSGISLGNAAPLRSKGNPATCAAILAIYAREIFDAATKHDVPPELIVMTIATETGSNRRSNFTGPDTFRWEARHTDYSAGPMQTLGATAREVIRDLGLPHPNPPKFSVKPAEPPANNPLYEGNVSIDIGTGYIAKKIAKVGLDPILVAASYNAGSIVEDSSSPWRLRTFGEHLNRSAEWFGDACFLLGELRQGKALDTSIVKLEPTVSVPNPQNPNDFVLSGLSKEDADEEEELFKSSGATVTRKSESGGTIALEIALPPQAGSVVTPPAANGIPVPDRDGYVICVSRRRHDSVPGKRRTVGVYQAFFNKVPIADIRGVTVEPHGPSDNGPNGVQDHRRIAAGVYPLFSHERPNMKYRTLNYAAAGDIKQRPWPSVRVENTGSRGGILIHCGGGFMMTIGCINFAAELLNPNSGIDFADSRRRVIAMIDSMKTRLGSDFPGANNRRIENACLIVSDDVP